MKESKVLDMKEIADIIGWSVRRVRDMFKAAGIVDKIGGGKRGGRYVTTLARIREFNEEIANAINKK